MYAVGRLSSYITRGVSTVSGPFHPFGGAVDIIVVQQQDGSLKSSPWYVRFGKFQGVLKARERVVDININGIDADFHMYLNPKGEAYFLREGGDTKSTDYNFGKCNSLIDDNNGKSFSRTLGFALDRKNINIDENLTNEEGDPNVDKKSAEIAADLLEKKWSTSLSGKFNDINHEECKNDVGEMTSGKLETSLVLHEEHFVHNPKDNENNTEVSKDVDKVTVANIDSDGIVEIYEKYGGPIENDILKEEKSLKSGSEEVTCIRQENSDEIKLSLTSNGQLQDGSLLTTEEQFAFSDHNNRSPQADHGSKTPNHESDSSPSTIDNESVKDDIEIMKRNIKRFASENDIVKSYKLTEEHDEPRTKSLPNIWSHLDDSSYYILGSKQRFSRWDLLRKDASRILKEGDKQGSGSQSSDKSKNGNDDSNKSWNLWPFAKSKSKRLSQREQVCKKDSDLDNGTEIDGEKDHLSKSNKMHKVLIPTAEQLQSLKLTEGKNTVRFTFSTAVLGNQQVDARIFLWKWDTHIVISDVDGTITKSDVLGQFMPLVGKDWTHVGVTHLFSAIKENGYELIFLSARSISQADVTRQFLINLKQEGKTLPEGPVVISPDGLFPSLFREVIRRAPHEFKIACLEDIRACFPDDWNPFYAGFGNRDTDEFSYLKVGISKGKIFIINPKGEVVVNHSQDPKSYSSLHSMVNEIFPPKSAKGEVVENHSQETKVAENHSQETKVVENHSQETKS